MDPLRELLKVRHEDALKFFYSGLMKTPQAKRLGRREAVYVASVLAHYAQTSCGATDCVPAPTDLTSIFDNFILDTETTLNKTLLETAGAQILLLVGCFPHQMRRRYPVDWYISLGSSFYGRAGRLCTASNERAIMEAMERDLRPWTFACREFGRHTFENRFLIQ